MAMTEEEKKRLEEEANKPNAVAATPEERATETAEFAKDKKEVEPIKNGIVQGPDGVDTSKAPNSEQSNAARQNLVSEQIRGIYKGYSTGEHMGDHWFKDDTGNHRTVQDRIGSSVFYRIPNSTDLMRVNANSTVDRISQQDYENIKYADMNKLQRQYAPAADRVRQRYEEFRDYMGRIPTQKELDAIMGDDAWAWQTVYGGGHGRFNTVMGGGDYFGHVNRQNVEDIENQYQSALKDRNLGKNTMEGALNTPDDNGNYKANKVVTKVKDANGNDIAVTAANAKAFVDVLKKWDNDTNTPYDEKLQKLKMLGQMVGIDIPTEDLYNNGGEVYGKMSTLVDALLNADGVLGDNVAKILAAEGVTHNADGTYTIPDEMSFDDIDAQVKDKINQIKLRTQEREIQRAQNRTGLMDLFAGAADMIKATNGARVDPRDWSQKYEKLDTQGQKLYDVYQARREQLRQEQIAKDAAAAANQQQLYRDEMKYKHEREIADANNLNKLLVSETKTEAQVKAALMKYKYMSEKEASKQAAKIMSKSTKFDSSLKVGDTNWGFAKDWGSKDMYQALYAYVKDLAYGNSGDGKDPDVWRASVAKKQSGMFSETDAMATVQRFFASTKNQDIIDTVNAWLEGRAGIVKNNEASSSTDGGEGPVGEGSGYHY